MRDGDLGDADALRARQARLTLPHVAPIVRLAEELEREQPGTSVPRPDPADGGVNARLLLLLEKPSTGGARTGLVSRDNPAGGPRTIATFMTEAGVPREASLVWNAVPWWNGTARVTAGELRAGALDRLLGLLPNLRAVCLAGRNAERAWALSHGGAVPVFVSAHPSANVRAAFPERWRAIPSIWRDAWAAARP